MNKNAENSSFKLKSVLLVHRTHSTDHFGARFAFKLLRFAHFILPLFVIIRIEPVIPAKDEVREVESIPISRHSRLRGNPGQKTIPNRIMLSVFHDAQTVFALGLSFQSGKK